MELSSKVKQWFLIQLCIVCFLILVLLVKLRCCSPDNQEEIRTKIVANIESRSERQRKAIPEASAEYLIDDTQTENLAAKTRNESASRRQSLLVQL